MWAYDAETLRGLDAKIPPGGTAGFIEVLEVPEGYEPLELGLYFASRKRIAWYDLRGVAPLAKADTGAGQLRLTLEDAYINLLEPSEQLPMMMLVQPGSSDKSYLWQKLNDTQKDVGGKGKRMPPGGLLDPADLELIRQWLDTGAAP